MERIVIDTNVFVAAAFNRGSASAQIVSLVSECRVALVWNESTRRETEIILNRIPRLSWDDVAPLFRAENRYDGLTLPEDFAGVPDSDDRKFAALASAAQATLITNDGHLLGHQEGRFRALKPSDYWRQYREPEAP